MLGSINPCKWSSAFGYLLISGDKNKMKTHFFCPQYYTYCRTTELNGCNLQDKIFMSAYFRIWTVIVHMKCIYKLHLKQLLLVAFFHCSLSPRSSQDPTNHPFTSVEPALHWWSETAEQPSQHSRVIMLISVEMRTFWVILCACECRQWGKRSHSDYAAERAGKLGICWCYLPC